MVTDKLLRLLLHQLQVSLQFDQRQHTLPMSRRPLFATLPRGVYAGSILLKTWPSVSGISMAWACQVLIPSPLYLPD